MWIIFLYTFTPDETTYTFPLPGFTTKWFAIAFQRDDLWRALTLSVQVAAVATVVALILGTLAAAAVYRSNFFGRESISFLLILPIALPGIVTGIALRAAIGGLDIPFSYWTIVIGHATFAWSSYTTMCWRGSGECRAHRSKPPWTWVQIPSRHFVMLFFQISLQLCWPVACSPLRFPLMK